MGAGSTEPSARPRRFAFRFGSLLQEWVDFASTCIYTSQIARDRTIFVVFLSIFHAGWRGFVHRRLVRFMRLSRVFD